MAVYDYVPAALFRRVGGREKPNKLETGREWVMNGLISYIEAKAFVSIHGKIFRRGIIVCS